MKYYKGKIYLNNGVYCDLRNKSACLNTVLWSVTDRCTAYSANRCHCFLSFIFSYWINWICSGWICSVVVVQTQGPKKNPLNYGLPKTVFLWETWNRLIKNILWRFSYMYGCLSIDNWSNSLDFNHHIDNCSLGGMIRAIEKWTKRALL